MMTMELLKKYGPIGLAVLFGICAFLLLMPAVKPPTQGKSRADLPEKENKEEISTESLNIQALRKRMDTADENIKKIYNNQVEINTTLTALVKQVEETKKTLKQNRAYIAMMYQKLLDAELQIQNIGGGFNVKQKGREEEINPLMGTETLPAP